MFAIFFLLWSESTDLPLLLPHEARNTSYYNYYNYYTCSTNSETKKADARELYSTNSETKKAAARELYSTNSETTI